jgi:serine/threonine-protein kinase RsbW
MIEMILQAGAGVVPGRKLARAAVCFLSEFLADENLVHDLDLALTEACANVVRHAYAGREIGDVRIRLALSPGVEVRLEVTDWGVGFDTRRCDAKPAPSDEGGRGLFIIKNLADEMHVSCGGGKTVVSLMKKAGPAAWKPCE